MPQQLLQHEPGVRGTLPDPAVGDGLPVVVEAGRGVDGGQFLIGLERPVLACGFAPGHVDGPGDMAGPLALLLGEVCRGENLAGELVRRADIDEVLGADGGDHLVAERADAGIGRRRGVTGGWPADEIGGHRPAIEFPFLTAAVEQLDLVVAVELEVPVGVGGEPVVVPAVEDDGVVVGYPAFAEQL